MIDYDQTLIESTRTHRSRLVAAFVHGNQLERRPVNNNLKRFAGSLILGAVICAVCLATGFVIHILQTQKEAAAITSFRQALAENPLQPNDDLEVFGDTGYLLNVQTGQIIDPATGFTVEPDSGIATDFEGHLIDPRTGWYIDPETGYYTDPSSGVTIDPSTFEVVDPSEDSRKR